MNKYELEHRIFRISILLKGIYSFFELFAGGVLLFVTSSEVFNFVHEIFKNELLEDSRDFIANSILNLVGNLPSQVKLFVAVYLIIHGAVKLGLIIGLWKRKMHFYPLAIGVFALFVVYQIYRYILHPSLILLALTDLDMLIIILTLVEWKNLRRKNK